MIINPYIFNHIPNIIFGFSTKIGLKREAPYYFNMSYSVGDDSIKVDENRKYFFNQLGLSIDAIAYQKQVHGDEIKFVSSGGDCGESDAMITTKKGIGLALSTADCCAIFIFDVVKQIIAGVHSGWRGTSKRILSKVLKILFDEYSSKPENLVCYLSPSISKANYQVGPEVAQQFDLRYIMPVGENFLLNISKINYDILSHSGVKPQNIQLSNLCSYEYSSILHSYRRDGKESGRSLGVIVMKDNL
ncbi:MAG: peptidoglycan editing factor PgeF [Ignavibacteriaceae bacterium]|jgi:purine-nucleoside/S-methyl-5'-thioadenosine phosphorylase / adenosine deaminase